MVGRRHFRSTLALHLHVPNHHPLIRCIFSDLQTTMGFSPDNFFVCLGLIALAHAAYSAAQHRSYLRLTEQEFTTLPTDILVQCLAGLVITCYGIVRVVGKFREIKAGSDLEKKTWETLSNRQSYSMFNHRGKILFRNDG